jgi:Uma2 family endonuclease
MALPLQTRYMCGPPSSDSHLEADPCFIVAVLSPSTAWRDKGRKLNAYLKLPTLERYILVNPLVRQVRRIQTHSTGPAL